MMKMTGLFLGVLLLAGRRSGQTWTVSLVVLTVASVVPGDKMYCAMQQTPESERAVQAMKTKLREKKNA